MARNIRREYNDLPGDCRQLCGALTAFSRMIPTFEWVVGGCPDDGTGPMMVVATTVGLSFIPANAKLPKYVTRHVFAAAPDIEWSQKRGWIGHPLKAVLEFGRAIGRPVSVVAAIPELLESANTDAFGIEPVTDDSIPKRPEVRYGLDRLTVVDPDTAEKVATSNWSALADLLPKTSDYELEPDNDRRFALWGEAVTATIVDDELHWVDTWHAFCSDQARTSAHKAVRADDETQARQYFADYAYFLWNLNQLGQAAAAASE